MDGFHRVMHRLLQLIKLFSQFLIGVLTVCLVALIFLSDALWFLAAIAADSGFTLEEIAQSNINKLFSRRDRGTLQGSGDNR